MTLLKNVIFCYAFLSLSNFALADTQTINVAADPWCPYNCEPEFPQPGIMIDIAREALAFSGFTLNYTLLNWARAKTLTQSGQLDGIVGMGYDQETSKLYHFPKTALGESQICFYQRATEDWQYQNIQDLDSKVFGWINDYGYPHPPLDQWIAEHRNSTKIMTIAGKDTHSRLFKLLQIKRIDTFAEDKIVIAYELLKSGLQRTIKTAGCLQELEKVFIAFSLHSPKKEAWANALDSGVKTLKESGRLAEILSSYGLSINSWFSQ